MLFDQGFTEQLWSLVCARRKKKMVKNLKPVFVSTTVFQSFQWTNLVISYGN